MSGFTDINGAAHALHLSYTQTLRLVLRGELRAVRIAGRWRIETESVERFAQQRANAGGQPAEAPAAK